MNVSKEQAARARLSAIEDGLRTLNDEVEALRSIIEAPEPVEKKPLLPETILRVEMIISNGADLKDAAAWQAYAEVFNTLLDLRRQPGSEAAEEGKTQWFIDGEGFAAIWQSTPNKITQICPCFDSGDSALAAREAVGLDRILHMYNTLHGRGYE